MAYASRKRRRKKRKTRSRKKRKKKRHRRQTRRRKRFTRTFTRKAGLSKLKSKLLKKHIFSRPPPVTPIFPNPHKDSTVSIRPR